LLQSLGFESPKEAGQSIGLLQTQGASALAGLADKLQALEGIEEKSIHAALHQMTATE
jgi:tryptophanyl-tRNA synthetase